jgi:hypothetical protein
MRMEPRLLALFLRSRLVTSSLMALAAIAAATGAAFARVTSADLTLLVWCLGPLAAAAVVGVAVRSPFGETERIASAALSLLRAGHVAGLVLGGTIGLALAGMLERSADVSTADTAAILTRNLVGLTGLALLAAVLIGAGLSWLAPLGYAGGSVVAVLAGVAEDAWWQWSTQEPDDGAAAVVAAALLVAGLAAVSRLGARDTVDDAT